MKLKPEEIRLLSKINGKTREMLPSYFNEYNIDEMINRLISGGFLAYADTRYKLSKLTIPILQNILAENGLSAKGKKADLIERAMSEISTEKLPSLDTYFIATAEGEEILTRNEPLLLHFNSDTMSTTEEVLQMQEQHPEMRGAEILKILLERKIERETDVMLIYSMTRKLQNIYHWIGGAEKAAELDQRLEELDKLYWEKFYADRERNQKIIAAKTGISAEEWKSIEDKAYAKLKEEAAADTMTDEEFTLFVDEQCSRFSEEWTKAEFRRIATEKRNNYDDEIFSLREALTRTANAMLKSEQR